jgi:hypothetical protein
MKHTQGDLQEERERLSQLIEEGDWPRLQVDRTASALASVVRNAL